MGLSLDLVGYFYLWDFSSQLFFIFFFYMSLFVSWNCLVEAVESCMEWIPFSKKKNRFARSFSSPLTQFAYIQFYKVYTFNFYISSAGNRDFVLYFGYGCLTKRFIPHWRYWSLWTVSFRRKNHSWNNWRFTLVWFGICY